jgi:D-alanine-D-alanine ligase
LRFRTEVRASDAAAVRALVEATGFFSGEEAAIALELVETPGYSFVFAEDDRGLLGYTCYGAVPAASGSFDLYWIAVHPRGQGSGVGKKLMDATESAIRELGGRKIWIETSGRTQYVPTRAFYSKCGFRIAATLDDFYSPGDAKVIFEKTISG